jgi:hypothetical protein
MNTEQYQPMNTIPTIPTEEGGSVRYDTDTGKVVGIKTLIILGVNYVQLLKLYVFSTYSHVKK